MRAGRGRPPGQEHRMNRSAQQYGCSPSEGVTTSLCCRVLSSILGCREEADLIDCDLRLSGRDVVLIYSFPLSRETPWIVAEADDFCLES